MESMSLLSVQLVYKYNLWLVVEYIIFIYLLDMGNLSSKSIEFKKEAAAVYNKHGSRRKRNFKK